MPPYTSFCSHIEYSYFIIEIITEYFIFFFNFSTIKIEIKSLLLKRSLISFNIAYYRWLLILTIAQVHGQVTSKKKLMHLKVDVVQ